MIDRAFLWQITNWSNGSIKKYEQRFYSKMALNEFKINEVKYNKLSKTNRKILIKLIKISEPSAKNFDDNQVITKYIKCNPSITLLKFIGTSKIEEFKTIIHAFACQAGSKIQLDHVLNRITIKKYIENLCNLFNDKTENQVIVDQINKAVDIILPYMFGSVVHKDENDKLKSDLVIDEELHSNIWKVYIDGKIIMYDFDTNSANGHSLINECSYKDIKINNPYDSIVLCDTEYKWCLSNGWVEI
jgi:hypothetical protein